MSAMAEKVEREHERLCNLCAHRDKSAWERPCRRCCDGLNVLTAWVPR